jgi:hypothetical protein
MAGTMRPAAFSASSGFCVIDVDWLRNVKRSL